MNEEKTVGDVPKNISLWMAMFLKLKNSSTASIATGEKVNRGGGYGLEIPCEYLVESDKRAVDWKYGKCGYYKYLVVNNICPW